MGWKATDVMDQKSEFALRAASGSESLSELCREFGISRKTGYKWKQRFLEQGLPGLQDRSRRPHTNPESLSEDVVCRIVELKRLHPRWGAKKLREVMQRSWPEPVPSVSSFKRVLEKAGLVRKRPRRAQRETGRLQTPLPAQRPNQVWTIDFKGWWHTRDAQRFEPLTIRDDYSRYILCARALKDTRTESVRAQMEAVFGQYGLPQVIRSDNGSPFAARNSPLGLTRLSAWWLALGIDLDRIRPGRPCENGGHERMHRDVAEEVEVSARANRVAQQAVLNQWRETFNEVRPHEALQMRVPAEVYRHSERLYVAGSPELRYPIGYLVRRVHGKGRIKLGNRPMQLSSSLVGYEVGLESRGLGQYAVWFGRLRLGELDVAAERFHAVCD
jgi:transposase InsO family protein